MTYTVPQGGELIPLMVRATLDGSAVGTSFYATVQIVAPSGRIMGSAITSVIAAGASADVTWFPRVGGGSTFTPTPGTGVPPVGNLDGYIFQKTNVVAGGVGHTDRSSLLIQGNAITLDGSTSIKVEFWCALVNIVNGVAFQAGEVELWDHFGGSDVDKGTIGLVANANASTIGSPCYATVSLTPAAGTHTYSLYGYKNVAGSTVTFFGSTFVDGTGNIAPMWYRVTTIAYDATLPS